MNATRNNIERLFKVIDNSLFMTTGKLDYDRVTDAFIKLADLVHDSDLDESIWYLGEFSHCCLSDLIVGAYWHYSDWHAGQYSKSYQALCALGQIFSPGMSSLDSDSSEFFAYEMLQDMAEKHYNKSKRGNNA